MRIMGLDYGTKTVGVAISDPLGLTAQAIETIGRKEENKLRRTCARIEELIAQYDVEKIILGFPKHMNNDIGERAEKSLEFRDMLHRRTGLEIVMWDERLTTVEAEAYTDREQGKAGEPQEAYRSDRGSVYSSGISGPHAYEEAKQHRCYDMKQDIRL